MVSDNCKGELNHEHTSHRGIAGTNFQPCIFANSDDLYGYFSHHYDDWLISHCSALDDKRYTDLNKKSYQTPSFEKSMDMQIPVQYRILSDTVLCNNQFRIIPHSLSAWLS